MFKIPVHHIYLALVERDHDPVKSASCIVPDIGVAFVDHPFLADAVAVQHGKQQCHSAGMEPFQLVAVLDEDVDLGHMRT